MRRDLEFGGEGGDSAPSFVGAKDVTESFSASLPRPRRRAHAPILEAARRCPQEGGQRLTGAGGRQDEGMLAALDGRPALGLRRRRHAHGLGEPPAHGRREGAEDVAHGQIVQ